MLYKVDVVLPKNGKAEEATLLERTSTLYLPFHNRVGSVRREHYKCSTCERVSTRLKFYDFLEVDQACVDLEKVDTLSLFLFTTGGTPSAFCKGQDLENLGVYNWKGRLEAVAIVNPVAIFFRQEQGSSVPVTDQYQSVSIGDSFSRKYETVVILEKDVSKHTLPTNKAYGRPAVNTTCWKCKKNIATPTQEQV